MFASFEATKDPKADEAFENRCQLCRAQNIEFTPELAIVARPRAPRVLVARRSSKARESSPEHLHLDRRQLGRCPVLEEEGMLRLLNYQNNAIARIEHLDGLPHLAFLDLYDNRIQNIENLDGCRNLRVLMLGKNQIMRIEKLNALEKLDVLDLHSNRIREVQNISHLKHLRVLNLAGNLLQQISGLDGLAALMELNIRRNAIASTFGLEKVPQLQRVFASHNHIVTHEGLRALGSIPNLRELSLDGNPVVESAEAQVYRAHILSLCPTLETLDNVKADLQRGMLAKRKDAEEQRHLDTHSVPRPKSPVGDVNSAAKAPVGIRSFVISPCPAAPQVEASSSPSQDMQRPLVARSSKTISGYQAPHPPARTAQCQSWLGDSLNVSAAPGRTTDPAKDVKASMTSDEVLQAIKAQWQEVLCGHALMTRHGYVKREHAKELSIFGRGLDALEKVEYQSTVTNIHFHYILVGALANEMVRLTKFKDLNSITFVHNQIQSPKELEPFRKLTRLRNVAIKDNPLCSGRASFRVSILRWLPQLRKIDGHDIEDFERVEASNLRASLPSPAATSRENTEDGSCEAIDMMMKRACQVDHQISMAHLHFDDVVRDAIREVWLDLHSERVGVTATTGAGSRMTNLTAAAPAFCDHGPVLDD